MKRSKLKLIWKIVSIILISVGVMGQAHSQSTIIQDPIDSCKAMDLAQKYTGFDKLEYYDYKNNKTGTLKQLSDDIIPILNKKINNGTVWQIDYDNIFLYDIRKNALAKERSPVVFHVMIDANSGNLLKIWSKFRDTIYVGPKDAEMLKVEKALSKQGVDTINLPDIDSISFLVAFQNCPLNITEAAEMEAFYLLQRISGDSIPRPVWRIILYGYPYIPSPPPIFDKRNKKPATILTTMEMTMDGVTGEPLFLKGGGR